MGHLKPRRGRDGTQLANKAWQQAESRSAEGRLTDPRRGRRKFEDYVINEWLPNHVMELTTREAYTYDIYHHILPWFTGMRMNEIMPGEVRNGLPISEPTARSWPRLVTRVRPPAGSSGPRTEKTTRTPSTHPASSST
jgi:hypothetical protein